MNWQESTILVTGGTGSFGRKFTEILLKEYRPKKLIIVFLHVPAESNSRCKKKYAVDEKKLRPTRHGQHSDLDGGIIGSRR